MTPRDRAIRRAWENDGNVLHATTAAAVRKRCTVWLFVQWRNGRARFRTGVGGDLWPIGFAFFGYYASGLGWRLSHRFLSRAEIRAGRKRRKQMEHNRALLAEVERAQERWRRERVQVLA